jgi:glycosyltransferase involved in cell wall biosynthesis
MTFESNLPLISCICVTNRRPNLLLKSILLFIKQDYHKKELVITYPVDDESSSHIVDMMSTFIDNLVIVKREANISLGSARNNAVEKCNGQFVCIWDDDDFYPYNRLTEQYSIIRSRNVEACILTKIFLYHQSQHSLYISYPQYWTGSLLCNKDVLIKFPCPDKNQWEFEPLVSGLFFRKKTYLLDNGPFLYTYIFHGDNIMKYTTFLYILNRAEPILDNLIKDHYLYWMNIERT